MVVGDPDPHAGGEAVAGHMLGAPLGPIGSMAGGMLGGAIGDKLTGDGWV